MIHRSVSRLVAGTLDKGWFEFLALIILSPDNNYRIAVLANDTLQTLYTVEGGIITDKVTDVIAFPDDGRFHVLVSELVDT